jgi:hypothetical protein
MTPGTLFIAKDFNEVMSNCRQNYLGKVWCALNFHGSDGRLHAGYANGYYLSFDNGKRVACVIRPSLPECQGSGLIPTPTMTPLIDSLFCAAIGFQPRQAIEEWLAYLATRRSQCSQHSPPHC